MAAEEQDSNRTGHILLRLIKRFERNRVGGRLGAAMKFLNMAESIRRAVQRLLHAQMPEKDELGGGQWMGRSGCRMGMIVCLSRRARI